MRSVLLSDEAEPDGTFLDGDEVFEAMKRPRRGVEVEVLVPGKSDVEIVGEVNEEHLRDLPMSEVVVKEIAVNRPWWRRLVGWLGMILMRKF